MTKEITANLDTHLASGALTVAICVRVNRADGEVIGFTTCDIDIPYGGVTYEANSVFIARTVLASTSEMNVDDMEFTGITSDAMTEEDLRNGVWDNCQIRMFVINYNSIGDGILKMGRGELGNVTLGRYSFQAEMRRMLQKYSQSTLRLLGANCDADFCDARCGLDSNTYSLLYKVKTVLSREQIELEPADRSALATSTSLTVINPGAEDGDFTGWTTALGTPIIDTGTVYAGTYSFWMDDSGGAAIYQDIDLVAEGLSTVDIDAERVVAALQQRIYSHGNGRIVVFMAYYDTSMVMIGEWQQLIQDIDNYYWTLADLGGVVPTLCRHIRIRLHGDASSGTCQGRVDAITLDTNTIVSGQKFALPITNPDAETGNTEGWTTSPGFNALVADATSPYAGTYRFKGDGVAKEYQDFTVLDYIDIEDVDSANSSFVLKWFQSTGTYTHEGYLLVEFFDVNSDSLGTFRRNKDTGVIDTYSSVDTWYEAGFDAPLPKGTRTLRIYMYTASTDVYFDEIEAFIYTGSGETITYKHDVESYYLYGLCSFQDGQNESLSREIVEHDAASQITLFTPPHYTIPVGALVSIREGCENNETDCKARGNFKRFRGLPFIPLKGATVYPDGH